ncbi:NYN domain-containing protein [Acetobacteraceae bacterium KSS8]|uniref:NYN domain-containing protein n=1 Tax=Endosaccharibacter trunci TaxID=2812733 RepID=A0ABT1W1V8_9PROT|nr:NYN domain-containing protein [Acetobacteraceae bacterium KSS8]
MNPRGDMLPREYVRLTISAIQEEFKTLKPVQQRELLRIYWYDGARAGRPSAEHEMLAETDFIKLRLGRINMSGEQKGVDARIINDLVELARNRAITDAVLLSGDEDLQLGVAQAQQFGVRVHLIGIQPALKTQSRSLRREADTTTEWDETVLARFLSIGVNELPEPELSETGAAELEAEIDGLVSALPPDTLAQLQKSFETSSTVPGDYDRVLLGIGRRSFGEPTLTDSQKALLRGLFVRLVRELN